MEDKKIILFLLLHLFVGPILATNPIEITSKLKFEPIKIDYEEGLADNVSIYHILEDADGIFWFGSTKGFYRFNGSSMLNMTSRINKKQVNIISSEWTTTIASDNKKRIWFGTTKGLYILDQETEHCRSIPLEKPEKISIDNAYIKSIAFKKESAFIGTQDGLYQVNMKTLKVTNSILTEAQPHNHKGTLSNIWTILPDISAQDVWFSSRLGLHRKSMNNRVDTFSIEGNSQEEGHFFLKSAVLKNKIFLADYKDGIISFNLETKAFVKHQIGSTKWSRTKSIIHLEEDLFLINAEINGIAIFDANLGNYHWLESNKTIKAGRYNLYKDSAGYIWFACNGKVYKSNLSFPSLLEKNAKKEVAVSLDIGYTFANGKQLDNLLGQPKMIRLAYTENNLQINFSLTNSALFEDISYQYKFDQNEWVDISEKNKLNLFDLSAGKHDLSIRAKNSKSEIASTSISIDVYRPFTKSPIFFALLIAGLIGLASAVYFYNKRQYEKTAMLKSKYETRLASLESQALRSQINPHFIFNTLNSIKYYSIEKSPEETSDFISSFSTLIRRILENSKKNLITLQEEIDTLRNYTDIEALRFHEQFDATYQVDPSIKTEHFLVPPMIIQPFIENAIWHGLMHKSGNRKLTINFKVSGMGIVCEVIDNGIGRKASNALKIKENHKSSLGMKITKERMEIINVRNLTDNSFVIEDLLNDDGSSAGTKASIFFIPKENN